MADEPASGARADADARVNKVLAEGSDALSILRGFVGASDRDGFIRVHPSLADTTTSVEIAKADVVDTADVLNNNLGKQIIWVKKGAQITVTKSRTTEFGVRPRVETDKSSRAGTPADRLQMQTRSASVSNDVCVSVCSCGTCQSQCTNVCGVCICMLAE